MKSLCYINDKILPLEETSVSATCLGLQRGYAVFDFVRTRNGKLFHIEDHLDRLRHSAAELHLRLPLNDGQIRDIAQQLIDGNDLKSPAIRLILTGGCANTKPPLEQPDFIMIAEELPSYTDQVYSEGAKLISVEFQRELPRVKSINYLNAIRLEPLKQKHGAFDILYYQNNRITECPRNNFFLVRNDRLITPKDDVLHGVTRKLVMLLARDLLTIEERTVTLDELESADEAFVTSTSKGIIPIVQIDELKIGDGAVGVHTHMLMELFKQYSRNY